LLRGSASGDVVEDEGAGCEGKAGIGCTESGEGRDDALDAGLDGEGSGLGPGGGGRVGDFDEAGGGGREGAGAGCASGRGAADAEVSGGGGRSEVDGGAGQVSESKERGRAGAVDGDGAEVVRDGREDQAGEWKAVAGERESVGVAVGAGGEGDGRGLGASGGWGELKTEPAVGAGAVCRSAEGRRCRLAVAVADVLDEDGFEGGGCRGRGEGGKGLCDLVPLDGGLAGDDVAEVESAVVGGENRSGSSAEGDIGWRGPAACGDGEQALAGSGLRGGESDDNRAGAVTGERGSAVGGFGKVSGECEGE